MHPRERLDKANIKLGKELMVVKSSLDTYRVIGLNASRITRGKVFFGHAQGLSLVHVALGLAKVFEREREERPKLCSISGIYRLAKEVEIRAPAVANTFARKYGVQACGNWIQDVQVVFANQEPVFRRHLGEVYRVRHTRIAHLQQDAPSGNLPSIDAFEKLLAFAVDFRFFVNDAFLDTSSHPILQDGTLCASLTAVLKDTGVSDVVSDFQDL